MIELINQLYIDLNSIVPRIQKVCRLILSNIDGKLPVTLNNQYQSGYGIKLNTKKSAFNNHLNLKFEETVDIIDFHILRDLGA